MSNFLEVLFGLKDKTAVVIGGTGVLCGEIAQGLAQAGAEIVIVGRNPEKATERLSAIEQAGGKGYFLPCEVSKKEDLKSLLSSVVERSDGVDIVVNGAGINSPTLCSMLGGRVPKYSRCQFTGGLSILPSIWKIFLG